MTRPQLLKIFSIVLSVLLGGVFVLSAISKLFPIEPFEYTFVEYGISGWKLSVIIARLFIGIELACAALLICNLWLRRFTIPLVLIMLMSFNIYLVVQLITFGNKGNCGCFGDLLYITPWQGILKNIAMMAVGIFIYKYHKGLDSFPFRIASISLSVVAMALPFVLNPVNFSTAEEHYSNDRVNYKLDLDLLYHDARNAPPKAELRKGKWVIAFLSLTCPHCRIAAKKLHVIQMKDTALKIHLILNGDKAELTPFFEDTRANNISWSMFLGAQNFIKLAGVSLPQILWVDNSVVVKKSRYFFLEQSELEQWQNLPH